MYLTKGEIDVLKCEHTSMIWQARTSEDNRATDHCLEDRCWAHGITLTDKWLDLRTTPPHAKQLLGAKITWKGAEILRHLGMADSHIHDLITQCKELGGSKGLGEEIS